MGAAWDIADDELVAQLNAIRADWATLDPWNMHLFQNPFEPGPGTEITDYVEADFPGYAPSEVDPAAFSSVTIAAHVAMTSQPDPNEFTADATTFTPQPIYGYYITNADDELVWGESFEESKTVAPEDILRVTARYRHRNYAAP